MTYKQVLEKYQGKTFGNAKFADDLSIAQGWDAEKIMITKEKLNFKKLREVGITPEVLDEEFKRAIAEANRDVLEVLGAYDLPKPEENK